eukprot:12915958-Prorocentrum_lima.AAC.1
MWKHYCCFCLGTYYANNKFLFIDQKQTISMQSSQGTLGQPTPCPKDVKVNCLSPDWQKYFMEGPMESQINA